MINNDILRRISKIFAFNNEKLLTIFSLSQCDITAEQLDCFFKEKNDPQYKELLDIELASFLNGLIIEKRGKQDGPQRQPEQVLNNNIVFNKLKIALALKADDVIAILDMANLNLGKYELSAFFRNINHKHYRECSDQVLSTFLSGLQIKYQR
ncbi:DUF1456 family protein [Colwellia sp. RSH04]|uniref:DUF1456 family protein n=1 Tax=Colwellia sp. RSH04 TaxID=2305464 RepID=UPI000E58E7B5|nr:DUF1456 family protein [Colwellia sp. RSH04]RHW76177.1 DUF1456 family protein [Colwellia sp. RSH04]